MLAAEEYSGQISCHEERFFPRDIMPTKDRGIIPQSDSPKRLPGRDLEDPIA